MNPNNIIVYKPHPTAGEDSEGGAAAQGDRGPRIRGVVNFPSRSKH